jgi:hypothetical protein
MILPLLVLSASARPRPFRVTYATARLQTLDHGAPVSPWTVEKELRHGSRDMLEEVYGCIGEVRHRSEVVEYRVEQHCDWKDENGSRGGRQEPKKAPVIFRPWRKEERDSPQRGGVYGLDKGVL